MIAVALKSAGDDPRWSGLADAEAAAIEVALTLAAATGDSVTACTVGPAAADGVLRLALAAGCAAAVRVDAPADAPSDDVALALASVVADAAWILCGNASSDRGSGAVPAFLAAELGVAQALGLVAAQTTPDGTVTATRRLDGGRREELSLEGPAVLSVEGAVARLRRPSIAAELAARDHAIEVIAGGHGGEHAPAGIVRPYRPRARVLPGPEGATLDRVRTLLAAGTPVTTAETVTLDPEAAAIKILDTLRTWGYLAEEP